MLSLTTDLTYHVGFLEKIHELLRIVDDKGTHLKSDTNFIIAIYEVNFNICFVFVIKTTLKKFKAHPFHTGFMTLSKKYGKIKKNLNLLLLCFDYIGEIDFKINCKEVIMCMNSKPYCMIA